MKFDVLHNFISPVTGRILADPNYVLVGNSVGIATPSPALIDLRLDLINLRRDYNVATSASFIIGFANLQLPNAQVLSSLINGVMINIDGIVNTSNTIPIVFLPDLTYQNIWIGDIGNRPVEQPTISVNNLPNLTYQNIWIGSFSNRPVEQPTITLDNLPDLGGYLIDPLFKGEIWRGTFGGRPEISDSLSILEIQYTAYTITNDKVVAELGQALIAAGLATAAAIGALQLEIAAIITALANLDTKVKKLSDQIDGLQDQIDGLQDQINDLSLDTLPINGNVSFEGTTEPITKYKLINLAPPEDLFDAVNYATLKTFTYPTTYIGFIQGKHYVAPEPGFDTFTTIGPDCVLNIIPAMDNVSFNNYRIIDLANPIDPTDGVNLQTLQGSVGAITLEGFVEGGPPIAGVITTTIGPDCLLTNIPAGGDVSLENNRITNLQQSPEQDFDAVSFTFLWDLMHDKVEILWP